MSEKQRLIDLSNNALDVAAKTCAGLHPDILLAAAAERDDFEKIKVMPLHFAAELYAEMMATHFKKYFLRYIEELMLKNGESVQ